MTNDTVRHDTLAATLGRGPVIPVIVVENLAHAVPLAQALVAGGLTVLEVTLRTPVALEAIALMRAALPDAIIGVGTVLYAEQLHAAAEAGASFAVSPGLTDALATAALAQSVPLLPGIATVSEAMAARERGLRHLKFFPAEAAGGAKFLSSLASVIPDLAFCPTGGIGPANAGSYLALPNVACVGGSWMIPKDKIQAGDWVGIEALAREAAGLR
jgi:2-dehydro-3-deoxyphosphogluconate aldolase / (4S)-4-hydroxy-2-oxoglutarate aldolase